MPMAILSTLTLDTISYDPDVGCDCVQLVRLSLVIKYLHYSHIICYHYNAAISDISMHADGDTIYTCVRYS